MRTIHAIAFVLCALLPVACDRGDGGGGDEGAARAIGPEGGAVAVREGRLAGASVEVPPGALAAVTRISIDGARDLSLAGHQTIGPAVKLGPPGTALAVPARVTVPFDPARIPTGAALSDVLALVAEGDANGPVTALLPFEVDAIRGRVTVETNAFSVFQAAVDVTGEPGALALEIVEPSISEQGGSAVAIVTRSGATSEPLLVRLESSDTTEATVPRSITILAGSASASFFVHAADDKLVDGTQVATIRAKATGFAEATATVDVEDAGDVEFDVAAIQQDLDAAARDPASFSAAIEIVGGAPPYEIEVTSGALPPGVSLQDGASPRLAGAWNASGPDPASDADDVESATFSLRVVSDAEGRSSDPRQFTVALPPRATLRARDASSATKLEDALKGTAYDEALEVTGAGSAALGTLTFVSVTPDFNTTAPDTLAFNSAARTFSGTPETFLPPTSFTFVYRDPALRRVTGTFSFTVFNDTSLTLTPDGPLVKNTQNVSLGDAKLNSSFSATISPRIGSTPSGVPPYTIAIAGGQTHTGITATIQNNGTENAQVSIAGTPTASGELGRRQIAIQVTDAASTTVTRTYDLRLIEPDPTLSPGTTSPHTLAGTKAGASYAQTFSVTGGTPPFDWAIVTGTIPAGTSFAEGSGNATTATLSGTVSADAAERNENGVHTFTVSVSDSHTDPATEDPAPRTVQRTYNLDVRLSYRLNIFATRANGPSFQVNCVGCHGDTGETAPDFNGTNNNNPSADKLIGVPPRPNGDNGIDPNCDFVCQDSLDYVVRGNASSSLVFQKYQATAVPCGACMPHPGTCNSTNCSNNPTAIGRLQRWINELQETEVD